MPSAAFSATGDETDGGHRHVKTCPVCSTAWRCRSFHESSADLADSGNLADFIVCGFRLGYPFL